MRSLKRCHLYLRKTHDNGFVENTNSGNHMKTSLKHFACNIVLKMCKRGFVRNWKVALKDQVSPSPPICVKSEICLVSWSRRSLCMKSWIECIRSCTPNIEWGLIENISRLFQKCRNLAKRRNFVEFRIELISHHRRLQYRRFRPLHTFRRKLNV